MLRLQKLMLPQGVLQLRLRKLRAAQTLLMLPQGMLPRLLQLRLRKLRARRAARTLMMLPQGLLYLRLKLRAAQTLLLLQVGLP